LFVVAPKILDLARIVLNFISFFLSALFYQNKWCRDEPVDVSLQILKLSEGLSER
jgi:hypothetical protein